MFKAKKGIYSSARSDNSKFSKPDEIFNLKYISKLLSTLRDLFKEMNTVIIVSSRDLEQFSNKFWHLPRVYLISNKFSMRM